MTAFLPDYRLTVYAAPTIDPTETTVLTPAINAYHSDPFKVSTIQGLSGYQPFLAYPQGRKGTYDPLTAKSTIGQLVFKIQDQRADTSSNTRRWLTAFMGDVKGKMNLSGLKAVVEESLDNGSTWTPFYVGRISDMTLDDVLSYGLTIREPTDDLQWNAFNYRPVLGTSGSVMQCLCPIGTTGVYGPFPAAGALSGSWQVTGSGSAITITKKDKNNPVNKFNNVLKGIAGIYHKYADGITWYGTDFDFVTGSNTPIRAFVNSGSVAGQFDIALLNVYQQLQILAVTAITVVELPTTDPNYTPLSSIGNNASVMVSIQPMYAPIDDNNPVFISGVHPVQIFKDLCLGNYGRIDLSTGQPINSIPVDNSAFNTLLADPSFATPRFKVTQTMKIIDFFEKYLAPFGIGYRIEPQLQSGSIVGAIVPFDSRLPKTLVGLPTLVDSDLADYKGTWQMGKPLSQIQIKYYNEEYIPTVDQLTIPWRLTETTSTDIVLLPENLKANGDTLSIDALGIRTDASNTSNATNPKSMVNTMESYYISRFGNGANTVKLNCRRTATTNALKVGQWCLVQITHLPDALSHLRGGIRLMQVTERSEAGVNVSFQFMDGGISAAAAPPVVGGIVSSSLHPTTAFDITFAAVTSSVRLELDVSATDIGAARPMDSSSLWTKWAIFSPNTTASLSYEIGPLAPNTRYYPRIRSLATTGEQPSAWAYPSNSFKDTAPVTPPISLSYANLSPTSVDLSWSNNGDLSSSIQISVSSPSSSVSQSVALLVPGSTTYRLTGLSTGSAANPYKVYVTHKDIVWGVSSTPISIVFGVSGSLPIAPSAGRLVVEPLAQWSLIQSQVHTPTGIVLSIYPASSTFDLELQRTPDSGSVPDPTQWNTINVFPSNTISLAGFMTLDPLPLDGSVYWYRMCCTATGYQDGVFTTPVSASTRQVDVNPGGTPDSLLSVDASFTATNASSSAATATTLVTTTSASLSLVSSSLVFTRVSASAAYVSSAIAALNIFTDSTGKLVKTPSTSSAGLYLGSTYLGYYNGSNWATYMSNTGNFYLTGSSNHFLAWDGTNLNIGGAITLLDLTVPFGMSVTPGQNLLTSAQDWKLHNQPITASLVANFNTVYSVSNSITMTTGPFGTDVKLWKVVSDGAGVNGGWFTDVVPIDPTKTYRYTCWVMVSGSTGLVYHGTGGNQVADISTSIAQPSPYFVGGMTLPDVTGTQWYLMVGFVYPYNYGTTQRNNSGLYSKATGQKVSNFTDWKWASAAITGSGWDDFFEHATTVGHTAYFYNPSLYVVDGSEPTIDSLLSLGASATTSASLAQTSATNASASAATANTLGTATSASLSLVSSSFVQTRASASAAFVSSTLSALNIFTDSNGKIVKTPNTSSAGLYLGSTYLGYWDGDSWNTFMSNTGNFYLTGSSNHVLAWDGTNLTIAGNITLLDLTVPFGTSVTPGQNLLTSAQDWTLNGPPMTTSLVNNFNIIGASISQSIVMTTGPLAYQIKAWQIIGGASSGSVGNGGWNSDIMSIDPTKTYRYATWAQYVTGSDGRLYHGTLGNTVADIPTGTPNVNPYFWFSGVGVGEFAVGEWYLIVGYVYPYNFGTTQYNNGGAYRRTTGTKVANGTDYKWASAGVTGSYWRNYLFYSADHNAVAYFANPMVHIVDGTEPSLDSLLAFGSISIASSSLASGLATTNTTVTNNSSSLASKLSATSSSLSSSLVSTNTTVVANSSSLASSIATTNTTVTNNSSSIASRVTTVSSSLSSSIGSTSASLASNIFTDTTGLVTKTPTPSGKGLFLGSTNLGYYSGSSWYTYMDNTGKFFLIGTGSNSLYWDGAGTLSITGSISATTGTIDGDLTIQNAGQLLVATSTVTGSVVIGQYDTQNSGIFSSFSNPTTPTGTAKVLFGKTAIDGNQLNMLAPLTVVVGAGASNDYSSKGGADTSPISFIRMDANSTSDYKIRYISSNNNTPYNLQRWAGPPYTPTSSYAHAFDGDMVIYRTNQGSHTGPVLTVYGDFMVSGTVYSGFSGNNIINGGGFAAPNPNQPPFSDARLKSNVTMLTSSLDRICELQAVNFEWNENTTPAMNGLHDIGLIAQDVAKVIPDVVYKDERIDDYWKINYIKIVPYLIESIKELRAELESVKTLKREIDDLKSRNTS